MATKKSSNTFGQDNFLRHPDHNDEAQWRHGKNYDIKRCDSGVELGRFGIGKHDSIEELYFEEETSDHFQTRSFRPQKQWKSEFVICGPALEAKRSSNGAKLDLSSLSLNASSNQKTFGETIRGF